MRGVLARRACREVCGRGIVVLLAVAGIVSPAAVFPTVARAGSYAVLSCPGDEGWSQDAPSASFVVYHDGCADSATGGLSLALGPDPDGSYASSTGGAITFSVPAGRSIATYTMSLSAYGGPCAIEDSQCANGFGDVYVDHTGQSDPDYDYRNLGYGAQTVTVTPGVLPSGVSWVTLGVGCDGGPGGDPCPGSQQGGPEALAQITSAVFVLASEASPSASGFGGSLLEGQAHGTALLRFTADDPGGPGIYEVSVQIDGSTIHAGTPDGNDGACAPIGTDEGVLEFEQLQPCKESETVQIPLNTTALADGQHTLTVSVADAAGNTSVVYSGTIATANRTTVSALLDSPASGALSGELPRYALVLSKPTAKLRRRLRCSFERSALAFAGKLLSSAGTPAPGITVSLTAQQGNDPVGAVRVLAHTTTNAAGQWSLHAPKGPSRLLRLAYGQKATAASAAESIAFSETVRPSLSLHVASPGGGRIVFAGRLRIRPLGSPRPLVSIQTRAPGDGWETVGVPVRVQRNGNYRYTFTSSPLTYGRRFAFRASTPSTSLWRSARSPVRKAVVH